MALCSAIPGGRATAASMALGVLFAPGRARTRQQQKTLRPRMLSRHYAGRSQDAELHQQLLQPLHRQSELCRLLRAKKNPASPEDLSKSDSVAVLYDEIPRDRALPAGTSTAVAAASEILRV